MTILEEGIVAFLIANADIHAVVADRIYPMRIPQAADFPLITYQRISTPRILTHDSSGATGDLTSPRFQFDVWAETQLLTKQISDVLRGVLHGKTGATGGVTIGAILADNEAAEFVPELETYRGRSDYIIWYEEA